MKRVACYCRVSTEEQVKFGFSIQAQKDALMKYCKENGFSIEEGARHLRYEMFEEIKIKTKSSNPEEKCKTLSFIAKTSHRFYLEVANQLENFFSQPGQYR